MGFLLIEVLLIGRSPRGWTSLDPSKLIIFIILLALWGIGLLENAYHHYVKFSLWETLCSQNYYNLSPPFSTQCHQHYISSVMKFR